LLAVAASSGEVGFVQQVLDMGASVDAPEADLGGLTLLMKVKE
jgi:hypothetical protein